MEEGTDFDPSKGSTISPKTVVSLPLSSLYTIAVAVCGLIWMGIRLWVGSIDAEFRAVRTAISAEEAARLQNDVRTSRAESDIVELKHQHRDYDRGFEAAWKKFDRLEDDRWNNHRK